MHEKLSPTAVPACGRPGCHNGCHRNSGFIVILVQSCLFSICIGTSACGCSCRRKHVQAYMYLRIWCCMREMFCKQQRFRSEWELLNPLCHRRKESYVWTSRLFSVFFNVSILNTHNASTRIVRCMYFGVLLLFIDILAHIILAFEILWPIS